MDNEEKCPNCQSTDLNIDKSYIDEETGEEVHWDTWQAKCNKCGYNFLIVWV